MLTLRQISTEIQAKNKDSGSFISAATARTLEVKPCKVG